MGFLTTIQERYYEIVAMSFNRKKALKRLDDLQITIARHLFLLSQYRNHSAAAGWLRELRAWNGELRLLNKGKKGRLNYSQKILWQALWVEPLGGPDEQLELAHQVADEKGLVLVTPDSEALKQLTKKFVDAVLDKDATHRFDP